MANSFKFPDSILADKREKVFIRFASGKGKVRPDGKGLSVELNLQTPDGKKDGTQICSGEVRGAHSLEDLLKVPKNPTVSFGDPGPIREVPVTAVCQATWTFQDGSSLTAIGKGTTSLVPLANGIAVVKDRAALTITGGTGIYQDARGSVDINSTVTVPNVSKIPFGKPGAAINQKSIETFRVFVASDLKR